MNCANQINLVLVSMQSYIEPYIFRFIIKSNIKLRFLQNIISLHQWKVGGVVNWRGCFSLDDLTCCWQTHSFVQSLALTDMNLFYSKPIKIRIYQWTELPPLRVLLFPFSIGRRRTISTFTKQSFSREMRKGGGGCCTGAMTNNWNIKWERISMTTSIPATSSSKKLKSAHNPQTLYQE